MKEEAQVRTSEIFVGASRKALVDGLLHIFEEVRDSRKPRWVSLEAPSGWGKTRVGRELFARLAETQDSETRYWPDAIQDADRKAVEPSAWERPASALPEYLWWGIACSVRRAGGNPSAMLGEDVWRLSRHGLYVEEQVKKAEKLNSESVSARRMKRALVARHAVGKAAKESTKDAAVWTIEQLVGATLPGVASLFDLARWGAQKAAANREKKRIIETPTTFTDRDGSNPGIVDQTVELLSRVTCAGFPVVILVEDVHDADELLLELLDRLLEAGGSLMVITTAWPERIDDHRRGPSLRILMESHGDYLHRVGHLEAAGEGFPKDAGLMMLDDDALREILHHHFAAVEAETEQKLVERYVNPLALRMFCEWLSVVCEPEDLNADGELELSEEDLNGMPQELLDIYREIWNRFPKEIQYSLAVATSITPASINADVAGDDDVWTAPVLRNVMEHLTYSRQTNVRAETVGGVLEGVQGTHSWVRSVSQHLRAFTEVLHKDIAADDGNRLLERYLRFDVGSAREEILNTLARILISGTELRSNANAARCALALHAEGYITDDAIISDDAIAIQVGILTLLETLSDQPGEFRERFRLYEQFLELDDRVLSDVALAIHGCAIQAYLDASRPSSAVDICREVLSNSAHPLGSAHPDLFIFRETLYSLRGFRGLVDEAVAGFEALVKDARRALGDDDERTLLYRASRAHWLGWSGRVDEAVAALESLVEDSRHALGDEDTLTGIFYALRDVLTRGNGEAAKVVATPEIRVNESNSTEKWLLERDSTALPAAPLKAIALALTGRMDNHELAKRLDRWQRATASVVSELEWPDLIELHETIWQRDYTVLSDLVSNGTATLSFIKQKQIEWLAASGLPDTELLKYNQRDGSWLAPWISPPSDHDYTYVESVRVTIDDEQHRRMPARLFDEACNEVAQTRNGHALRGMLYGSGDHEPISPLWADIMHAAYHDSGRVVAVGSSLCEDDAAVPYSIANLEIAEDLRWINYKGSPANTDLYLGNPVDHTFGPVQLVLPNCQMPDTIGRRHNYYDLDHYFGLGHVAIDASGSQAVFLEYLGASAASPWRLWVLHLTTGAMHHLCSFEHLDGSAVLSVSMSGDRLLISDDRPNGLRTRMPIVVDMATGRIRQLVLPTGVTESWITASWWPTQSEDVLALVVYGLLEKGNVLASYDLAGDEFSFIGGLKFEGDVDPDNPPNCTGFTVHPHGNHALLGATIGPSITHQREFGQRRRVALMDMEERIVRVQHDPFVGPNDWFEREHSSWAWVT